MRALIALPPAVSEVNTGTDRIVCCPELHRASEREVLEALLSHGADVLVHARPDPRRLLGRWGAARGGRCAISVQVSSGLSPGGSWAEPDQWARYDGVVDGVHRLSVPASPAPLARALGSAERLWTRVRAGRAPWPVAWDPPAPPGAASAAAGRRVLLVGLGIVNLVTAYFLARSGASVMAIDAAPDPRANRPWTEYGCTRGGGNARMFTLTEADDYHDRRLDAVPDNHFMRLPVSERGWLLCDPGERERRWLEEFERVPGWLARTYTADTLALNRRSGGLWSRWLEAEPDLFADVGLRHGILRLYSEPEQFRAGRERQEMVGALVRAYSSDEVRAEFPALAAARDSVLAGGLSVKGFTLQVHDLMDRLLDRLERLGAELRFGVAVEEVLRDRADRVAGVIVGGALLEADDYVFSPGVTGWQLARGRPSHGAVHGVLGCWATIPNPEPGLPCSLKIARKGHRAEDANVTVIDGPGGRQSLIFGSGYGYVGEDPMTLRTDQLDVLFEAVLDSVSAYFPDPARQAGEESIRASFRVCVRPWSATNLGIFDCEPAVDGRVVWAGANNTGGFAQAPVIAEAVAAALAGGEHPMHAAYAPQRLAPVLGPASAAAIPG
jgi:glycine/D-amino acid oxidase-like deaminating enzyme